MSPVSIKRRSRMPITISSLGAARDQQILHNRGPSDVRPELLDQAALLLRLEQALVEHGKVALAPDRQISFSYARSTGSCHQYRYFQLHDKQPANYYQTAECSKSFLATTATSSPP
jgi:hypothetical protein